MTYRRISDYLLSGEANGLRTKNTIDFTGLEPKDGGLFTRVDEEGMLYGHRVPNQDLEWSATSNADVELPSTEVLLVEVTVDHVVTQANGSFLFKASLTNGSNNSDDFVNIVVRDGSDNPITSKNIQINKGDTNMPITFYGGFAQDWPSGTTFRFYGTSSNDSTIKGTTTPTGVKVVEAQAAPVTKASLDAFDFSTLPQSDPQDKGKLWVNHRGSLRVSQG
jgi:hypothetical protein